ncbi:MAG: CPBP family intramembrane metalloprotease, partial [Verrucomicrobiae bacterium]|nr:CPBP family intramembrane metalloprotease [Verrucomicrobiae bacterium]
ALGAALLATILLTNALGLLAKRLLLLDTLEARVGFHVIGFALAYSLIFALVHHFLGEARGAWRRAFGLSAGGWRRTSLAAAAGLLTVIVPAKLAGAAWHAWLVHMGAPLEPQPVVEWFLKLRDPRLVALLVVLTVAVAPVVEEALFRGIFHPFLRERFGPALGLTLGALAFAGFHLHLPSLAPLFLLAVVLALTYEWSGNLAACMALHAGFNALAVTGLLVRRAAES